MVTSGNKKIAAEKKSKGKEGGVDTEQVMMNVVGMQIIIKELIETLKSKTKEEKKEGKKKKKEEDLLKQAYDSDEIEAMIDEQMRLKELEEQQ